MKIVVAFGVLLAVAFAQTAALPKFEVSSIRPAVVTNQGAEFRVLPSGQLQIQNLPLKFIIMYAWELQSFQLMEAKGWIDSQGYDVLAKPEVRVNDGDMRLMLRALLADRFGLRVHSESRELPIYALTSSKPSTKPGPPTRGLATGLAPGMSVFQEGGCEQPDPAKLRIPLLAGQRPPVFCGQFLRGRDWMKGAGVPISEVVEALSTLLRRKVVDETGLKGKYNIDLQWAAAAPPVAAQSEAPNPAVADNASPSLVGAIEEQLGLKLQSRRGPVEILVIDAASRPDEN